MNKRRAFVVVPSLTPTGPIKGAAALCNGLVEHIPVTLVPLKTASGDGLVIDSRVEIVSLASCSSWLEKHLAYKKLLQKAGSRAEVVSLSLCLSADTFNYFIRAHAIIISSVRGNLMRIYRFDFGRPGLFAAFMHYQLLKKFNKVVAMSNSMEKQLRKFGIRRTVTIGNFIDEANLEAMRLQPAKGGSVFRFTFLASLSERKRPDLLVKAIRKLRMDGIDCCLDLIGDGPWRSTLEEQVRECELRDWVTFYGNLSIPYKVLQQADCMVLPSEAEGIPRAVLEALFFGVPCILRNADANDEVICPGVNGYLFEKDDDLVEVMRTAVYQIDSTKFKAVNLLPDEFRQDANIQKFLEVIRNG